MHPRIPLAFLAARAHYWLMVNLSSTSTPSSVSTEVLSSRSAPSLYWCMGLFLPRCRTLHVPLCPTFQPVQVTLNGSTAFWCISHSSSFVSSANLLRVHSNSSSRSLMNKLNKTGPSTDPWGTPLVTGLQPDSLPLMTVLEGSFCLLSLGPPFNMQLCRIIPCPKFNQIVS